MARYLFDTNVLVDISRGREPTVSIARAIVSGDDVVAVTPLNVAEFMAGIVALDRERWTAFFDDYEYWHISYKAAVRAGGYRHDFARQGMQLHVVDSLIAAVAAEESAILVTNNARDFPLPDVRLLVPDAL